MTTSNHTAVLQAQDRAHVFHPSTHMRQHADGETPNRIIRGGQGIYIEDTEGKRTLDAFAGLYCVKSATGAARWPMRSTSRPRSSPTITPMPATRTSRLRLSDRLVSMAPGRHGAGVSMACPGSDANETQVKLVWYYNNVLGRPQKKKIIARERGYHGAAIMPAA